MGSAPGDQQAGPARGAVRDRRRELGAFLRSRRARLRPADRRITPAHWRRREREPGFLACGVTLVQLDPRRFAAWLHVSGSKAARLELTPAL